MQGSGRIVASRDTMCPQGSWLLSPSTVPRGSRAEQIGMSSGFGFGSANGGRCGGGEEAEAVMGGAIALGGELGVLAEEVDPATGEMLGNHPQALSHSTLVAAALSIEAVRASGKSRG